MKQIAYSSAFKRDFKRIKKRQLPLDKLGKIIELLATDSPLPPNARPHRLIGEYAGTWECHIEGDWLLIYQITEDELILRRKGTHQDLFKNY